MNKNQQSTSNPKESMLDFYSFIEANKAADGIDNIEDAVLQTTWVFLSRWQKVKVAFTIFLQSIS